MNITLASDVHVSTRSWFRLSWSGEISERNSSSTEAQSMALWLAQTADCERLETPCGTAILRIFNSLPYVSCTSDRHGVRKICDKNIQVTFVLVKAPLRMNKDVVERLCLVPY